MIIVHKVKPICVELDGFGLGMLQWKYENNLSYSELII